MLSSTGCLKGQTEGYLLVIDFAFFVKNGFEFHDLITCASK
jgi:hypothetical protein